MENIVDSSQGPWSEISEPKCQAISTFYRAKQLMGSIKYVVATAYIILVIS